MPATDLTIRSLTAADEPEWRRLWTGYLDYYETKVTEAVYASTFARLLTDDIREPRGLMALSGSRRVGLTHYIFHRHCWKIEDACYLQDLYTAPEARGQGVGRALIKAVYEAADAAGCPAVYWLTQEFNYKGRMLYDTVGVKSPFIRYNRPPP
ncbi:MAG: GNAT family N-acetyltransferase [Paracoccaceae bacterium]|nr:GNAT family N-acetyltransferase [Paracoccaceae bacterium]